MHRKHALASQKQCSWAAGHNGRCGGATHPRHPPGTHRAPPGKSDQHCAQTAWTPSLTKETCMPASKTLWCRVMATPMKRAHPTKGRQGPANTWRAHPWAMHITSERYGCRWTGVAAGGGTGDTPWRRQRITMRGRPPQERGRRGRRTSRLQSNAPTTALHHAELTPHHAELTPHHAELAPHHTTPHHTTPNSPTYNPTRTWKKRWSPPTLAPTIHPSSPPNPTPQPSLDQSAIRHSKTNQILTKGQRHHPRQPWHHPTPAPTLPGPTKKKCIPTETTPIRTVHLPHTYKTPTTYV